MSRYIRTVELIARCYFHSSAVLPLDQQSTELKRDFSIERPFFLLQIIRETIYPTRPISRTASPGRTAVGSKVPKPRNRYPERSHQRLDRTRPYPEASHAHSSTRFPLSIPIPIAASKLSFTHPPLLALLQRYCKRRCAPPQAGSRCNNLQQAGGGHGHKCCSGGGADAASPWLPVLRGHGRR